jgi:hypothetical protein
MSAGCMPVAQKGIDEYRKPQKVNLLLEENSTFRLDKVEDRFSIAVSHNDVKGGAKRSAPEWP